MCLCSGDHGLSIGIRAEQEADHTIIREINNAAFGREGEGRLVDELRRTPRFNTELSLLAEVDGKVVGHADYYPRFGFRPASTWGIRPPFEAPDEVFMALELEGGALRNCEGEFRYPREFEGL